MFRSICGLFFLACFLVTIKADPIVDLGPDIPLCQGDSLLLAPGIPQAQYLWQDGSRDSIFIVRNPGLYWVEVSDMTGTSRDSLWVGFIPVPFVDFPSDTLLCEEHELFLNVSTLGATYRWQDGSTDSRFQITEPGLYFVHITNFCGEAKDSIQVAYSPQPKADLGPDTLICEGESLLFNLEQGQDVSYLWENASEIPIRIIEESGIYYVEVSNYCGTRSDSLVVEVQYCSCQVFLGNAFTPNDDGHNDHFGPIFDCAFDNYEFQIFDRWGKPVFSSSQPGLSWDGRLGGSSCPEGVYIWVLRYDNFWSGQQVKQGSLSLFR